MKNRISKIISTILVLSCITASILTPATAIEPRYTGLSSSSISLNIASDGLAHPYGMASVRNGYTADVTMELQRTSNGYSWSSIKEWSKSGSVIISLDKEHFVVSGYTYRAKISVKVYDSNDKLVDSVTDYSGTVTY